jgi:hypothetical protein
LLDTFHAPAIGQAITIVPRIGHELTGQIERITTNTVTIGGQTYSQNQLTDKTCDLLFPEYHATKVAGQQVRSERDNFAERQLAEQRKAQAEANDAKLTLTETRKWRITPSTTQPTRVSTVIPAHPRPQKPSSDNTLFWCVLVLSVLAVAFIVAKLRVRARQEERREAMIGQANIFLSTVRLQKSLKPIPTRVLLKNDESAYLEDSCSLHETRSVRHYESGGVGFRIAKGVYVGGSKGRSVSTAEMTCIDSGQLTLTNKRLVFDGSTNDRTIPLDKLVSINSYSDAIEVSTANRQKSMYFTVPNPLIWHAAIKLLTSGQDPNDLDPASIDT